MSLLTRDRPRATRDASPGDTVRTPGTAPVRSPLLLGALGGGQAALGSLACVLVPVVLVWMASATTAAVWTEVVRTGTAAWLLGHRATVQVEGASVSLVPLGLTLLPVGWCWVSGRRLGDALRAVRGSAGSRADVLRAWGAFTVVYTALAVVASVITAAPPARTSAVQVGAGAAVLAAVVGGAAVLRHAGWPGRRSDAVRAALASVQRVLRAAGVALAAWLGAGAALAAVAIVLGSDRVGALREALAPGAVGGAGVLLAELAYLPTLVVWSAAWAAGPGFVVGTGTAVTPAAVVLGPLPAFPVLGALPEPATLPGGWWAVVALPVLAGVLAGWCLRRSARDARLLAELLLGLAVGVTAGAGGTALAWLASGAVGHGRMAELGPSPLWVGLCLAGEVAAGSAIAVLLLPRRRSAPGVRLPGRRVPGARVPGVRLRAAGQLERLRLRMSSRRRS